MSQDNDASKSSSVTISIHERGDGYVILAPKDADTASPQVPLYLSRTLERWIKDKKVRVRSALGIVQNGHTTALHVWYDDAKNATENPAQVQSR